MKPDMMFKRMAYEPMRWNVDVESRRADVVINLGDGERIDISIVLFDLAFVVMTAGLFHD